MAWSARDRLLAESLLSYEDSLCPGCGQPRDRAWDPRTEGEWEVHEDFCQPCTARHVEGGEHKPGRFVTVAAAREPGASANEVPASLPR